MKKIVFAAALVIGALSMSASQLTVTNTAAGKLSALIGNEARNVDSLTVEGPMDLKDIRVAWDGAFNGQLKYLNIAKAEFKDNKIPDYALYVKTEQKGEKRFLNIDEVVLPENLEEIGAYAFSYTMLTRMPLPSSLKRLGKGAFMTCNLTYDFYRGDNFRLPEGIEEIPDSCFYGAVKCNDFHFPQTIKRIGSWAFGNTMLSRIELPSMLEKIGDHAFMETTLKEVVFTGGCRVLGVGMFNDCPLLEKITLPDDAEIIPQYFLGHTAVTSIDIPASVRIIEEWAFGLNHYLTNVTLHEGIEEIKGNAFAYCDKLKKIVLPQTLQNVGDNAVSAPQLFCKPSIPPKCEGTGATADVTLYVPAGAKALYAEAEGWKNAKEIIELTAEEFEMAGIGDVTVTENSVTVIASNGQAIIETSADSPTGFAIYSTDGRLVTSGIAAPRTAVSLAPGIYIVRTADSTTKIAL